MLNKLFPIEHTKRVEDVDYERLVRSGYNVFLFDYDYTLAPWKTLEIGPETEKVFQKLRDLGVRVLIVTNAKKERVEHLEERFPWIEIHWSMRKPSLKRLSLVLKSRGIDPKSCVIIGDLFLTDILVGNRMGMYTVMVNPRLYEAREFYKWIVGGLSIVLYRTLFFVFGWFFRLTSLLSPNEWAESVRDIDYDNLIENGFKTFIFDFDNTLAPWRSENVPEEHMKILRELKERDGILVIVASNGKRRVSLPVLTLWKVGKPIAFKLRKELKRRKRDFKKTVVIGDQLFTDILFGNSIGAYTIKTQPLRKEEALITRFNRLFEKLFLKLLVQKPSLSPQDRN